VLDGLLPKDYQEFQNRRGFRGFKGNNLPPDLERDYFKIYKGLK
jgi:hypothetical protein